MILFAHGGTANVSGSIDATGGFVETSGEVLHVSEDFRVKADTWLLDPSNITISTGVSSGMTLFSAGVGYWTSVLNVNTLTGALNTGTNVTVTTAGTGGSAGDITVVAPIAWTAASTLTLRADNNIYINEDITATNYGGKLALYYGQSALASGNIASYTIAEGKKVNLKEGLNFSTKLGSDGNTKLYYVIESLGSEGSVSHEDLQGINGDLSGNYVLGADIDAYSTSGWNTDAGFLPIGNSTTAFSGIFDGLGHTISGLYIYRPVSNYLGLFGVTNSATIQNVTLSEVNVYSEDGGGIGGLIGGARNSTISNVNVSGTVQGWESVGGLIGGIDNAVGGTTTITNAHADVDVLGSWRLGGLVGSALVGTTTITSSSASGTVTSDPFENEYDISSVGGLVGEGEGLSITESFATGDVTVELWNQDVYTIAGGYYTVRYVGGLVGIMDGDITSSYATGNVLIHTTDDNENGNAYEVAYVGGLAGFLTYGTITGTAEKPSYATGNVSVLLNLADSMSKIASIGGLAGQVGVGYDEVYNAEQDEPEEGQFGQTIDHTYATGAVTVTVEGYDVDEMFYVVPPEKPSKLPYLGTL